MLDIKCISESIDTVVAKLQRRGFVLETVNLLNLISLRRSFTSQLNQLQENRKKLSKQVEIGKRNGEETEQYEDAVKGINVQIKECESELKDITTRLDGLLYEIPNLPNDDVPNGSGDNDNLEIKRWGDIKQMKLDKDHVDIYQASGFFDFESAVKITGTRFVVMKDKLATIHRALSNFMIDTHISQHGYTEVYVPYMVNANSLYGTGQLPKFEDDLFKVTAKGMEYYLIPTAEVPVTNLFRGQIVKDSDLPLKFVAQTPCFRSEAGAYGKDTRGIIRQHQFQKVELVQLTKPEESWNALEEVTTQAEKILQLLELPYRVVTLCAGDLGFSSAKTYDLEVWIPSQSKYREVSSCSNFLDYQARRMNCRYKSTKDKSKKTELVHTVNGSGLAVGRTLVALLENHNIGDEKVFIPKALRPYLNGAEFL